MQSFIAFARTIVGCRRRGRGHLGEENEPTNQTKPPYLSVLAFSVAKLNTELRVPLFDTTCRTLSPRKIELKLLMYAKAGLAHRVRSP